MLEALRRVESHLPNVRVRVRGRGRGRVRVRVRVRVGGALL